MRIVHRLLTGSALLVTAGLSLPPLAAEPNPECVRDAVQELILCKATCREEFQATKDTCRNIDHDCADSCRAGLVACLDGPTGPLTEFEACRDDCSTTLDAAKEACREQFAEGTPERDQCIDQAQLAAFSCRDACREGVATAVRACRLAFRTCILACPPPAED